MLSNILSKAKAIAPAYNMYSTKSRCPWGRSCGSFFLEAQLHFLVYHESDYMVPARQHPFDHPPYAKPTPRLLVMEGLHHFDHPHYSKASNSPKSSLTCEGLLPTSKQPSAWNRIKTKHKTTKTSVWSFFLWQPVPVCYAGMIIRPT